MIDNKLDYVCLLHRDIKFLWNHHIIERKLGLAHDSQKKKKKKKRELINHWIKVQTFSRKTRKGYWNAFKLPLIEEGCMWTSLLPSYHTGRPSVAGPTDCLRLPRVTPVMPCSVAATLGYKPAHSIACKGTSRIFV
jgi:hypothetical protein